MNQDHRVCHISWTTEREWAFSIICIYEIGKWGKKWASSWHTHSSWTEREKLGSVGWCFVWVSAATWGCALQINTGRGGDPGSQLLLPLSSLHPTRTTGPSLVLAVPSVWTGVTDSSKSLTHHGWQSFLLPRLRPASISWRTLVSCRLRWIKRRLVMRIRI